MIKDNILVEGNEKEELQMEKELEREMENIINEREEIPFGVEEEELTTVEIAQREIEEKVEVDEESKESQFLPIVEGEYEVKITKVEPTVFKSGNEGFKLEYRIRKDVSQRFKNRVIFDNLVLAKSVKWKISNLFLAVRIKENENDKVQVRKEDYSAELLGKIMRIKVTPERTIWNGKETIRDTPSHYQRSLFEEIEDLTPVEIENDEIDDDEFY